MGNFNRNTEQTWLLFLEFVKPVLKRFEFKSLLAIQKKKFRKQKKNMAEEKGIQIPRVKLGTQGFEV